MQILENSVIGLRSARHTLASPDYASRVTLFPMVHIGEAAFYARVYDDALTHDVVLLEGIKSRVVNYLTRSYRWTDERRLGLVVQPRPDLENAAAVVIRADLSTKEFESVWAEVPLWLRSFAAVVSPVIGVHRRFFASRRSIAKGMDLDDLPSREMAFIYGNPEESIEKAIKTVRDEKLCAELSKAILTKPDTPRTIAVVYGADHMPAVLRHLREMGRYSPAQSEWMMVFKSME